MKKTGILSILIPALFVISGCTMQDFDENSAKPYNLSIEELQAPATAYIGFPMAVTLTVSSDRPAEDVPYTLLLINQGDYDTEAEEPRYIDVSSFETIGTVEEGTNEYEVEAVIPDESGQSGSYYLVGLIDPAGDIEGDAGKLENIELISDTNPHQVVNLDTLYIDKTDFSVSEINLTSSSYEYTTDDVDLSNSVFVIRDTDRMTDPVISGSVTINTLGVNSQLDVPVAVYLMNNDATVPELVPGRLWDNEVKGYVEKYVIAELLPENPSVVHFAITLPAETRSYIRDNMNENNSMDLSLTVVLDPDNEFDEPEVLEGSGENDNMAKTDITVVYDSGGTLLSGSYSAKTGMSLDASTADISTTTGQWFEKTAAPSGRTGAASVTFDGNIYVFGGRDSSGNALDSIYVYDIAANTWSTPGSQARLGVARYDHAVTVCSDDWGEHMFILGGRDSSGNPLDSVEVFDVPEGYLYNNGNYNQTLSYARYGHTAVSDGSRIYVIGGVGTETSVEILRPYIMGYEVPMFERTTGPTLKQGRAWHGAEICYIRDPDDRTKEKAVIVVAGGMQNGVSTGSIETLYLERDAANSPADGDSLFRPSASNTWQKAGSSIETTLAAFSTASLELSSDTHQQNLYLFGGKRVYTTTITTCPDSDFSNCTRSTSTVTEPVSDVLSYNPFSDTLEAINTISTGARVWSTASEYTDDEGNNFACLIGGSETDDGDPSTEVNSFGFTAESFSPEPPEPVVVYPDERVQCDVDLDMYGGKKDLVGAGPLFMLSSKYTTTGYNFELDSGLAIDLFSIRLWPLRTEIKAQHYVNPDSADLVEIGLTLMNRPVVFYQKKDREISFCLSQIKDLIEEDNEDDSDDDDNDDEGKTKKAGEWETVNMFEVSYSLFKKGGKPPEKYIGPYFGLVLVLKWDGGFKAGWDFAVGFEKGTESAIGGSVELILTPYNNITASYDADDLIYNRAYIKPSAYGAIWGYLSAGVSAGGLLTLGIEAQFDIIRLDVALILANNFKFDDNTSPTIYGTNRSIGWTGTLSLVKGEANLYVEINLPDICSKKKWGIRWYYPCLKPKKKTLPWPKVSFCAFKMVLWNQHHDFGEVSDWVNYDPTITVENDENSLVDLVTDVGEFIYDW